MVNPYPSFSFKQIDYLQRTGIIPDPLSGISSRRGASVNLSSFRQLTEIGQLQKHKPPIEERKVHLPTEDLLIGLYGNRIPIAFLVRGTKSQTSVYMGVWHPNTQQVHHPPAMNEKVDILLSALHSLYPSITTVQAQPDLTDLLTSGFVLGMPTAKQPDPSDGAVAIDRLLRALSGTNWACLILALPEEEEEALSLRPKVIKELRQAQDATKSSEGSAPLLKHYTELLEIALNNWTIGSATGLWRTGVYLLGDHNSYGRLSSLWRGIFSGDESLPEPVRVWKDPEVARLAHAWWLPDTPGKIDPNRPDGYSHRYQYQTDLTSKQLAAYIHLPQIETTGFAIQIVPDFDAVPPAVKEKSALELGTVMLRSQPTGTSYEIQRDHLTRHVFVAGVTGAGKTHTIFHILKQLNKKGTPFLVIEPAKREYRALLKDANLSDRLLVFTLGNENISPFRLNPFEVMSDVPIGMHIDLLRSVFAASFGMWTPLPQVLEQCLYAIYRDRGWDITNDRNTRLPDATERPFAFPTLSDLAAKVEELIPTLGYEERVTADLRAALLTRINGLRTGGKGRMLDVQRSLPMSLLLETPTVLELERMGDDDDKAFLMGLLLIRLVEYRQAEHQRAAEQGSEKMGELKHLVIVEEAHRLLANVSSQARAEEANPRGKAVETFANLLAEIRAYGQGVLISDQVPVKLAPEVIKNTNLKIAHRVVADDDRKVLAGAMAMNERQAHALAILPRGQAAVFSVGDETGDDAPVVVRVPAPENPEANIAPGDAYVLEQMKRQRPILKVKQHRSLFLPFPAYEEFSLEPALETEVAELIIQDASFQRLFNRMVLSAIEDVGAFKQLWPDIEKLVRTMLPPTMNEKQFWPYLVIHAAERYSQRKGTQAGWTYSQTSALASELQQALLTQALASAPEEQAGDFQKYARQLHLRTIKPFAACEAICKQEPSVCLYRYTASDLMEGGDFRKAWQAAQEAVSLNEDGDMSSLRQEILEAGNELIMPPDEEWSPERKKDILTATIRASLCFAQQMLASDHKSPSRLLHKMDQLFKELGYE